jgi:hypothetical protein
MTTATFGTIRTATPTTSKARIASGAAPARRSLLGRWLVAMIERAQIRSVDHPEFAQYVAE